MTKISSPDGTPPSRLCFGAMQFGGTADVSAAKEMYDACRAAGVNFFDTAHVYTGGQSERMLGKLIAPERDKIILATKAAYEGGASRATILASVEDSRSRMQIDTIDLLYMHRWDADTPLEETFYTLAELVEAGTVRAIGVSNYAAWQVMKAQAVAARVGLRIAALQPMYNLVKRQAEVELLPMAQDQSIAVMPYSPLGGGLLTGKYARGGAGRLTDDARYAARYAPDWMHAAGRGLAEIADETGIAAATLAVAWVMRHPAVTAPIVSARSAEQLAPSLAALDLRLDSDLAERITALSSAPAPATDRLEEA
ncbi:aldo/keto reductase [Jannaschia seohaensis]|uniref:Predicted oxidoreductase n=1 Tax=Jannaschia seohaensis TaxID=475081 RepID=A0A2Y9A1A1_9RHOB|nr:aldo/keto reductase [Jannaschia seohaensis]PWJ21952.1 aryl-alcohol dehydrogenase-like predicted oxidoreductase [Jannaschia seohaensis]SSA38230.1 Predicted oxidoreductase [Jannaschia seohaensis]